MHANIPFLTRPTRARTPTHDGPPVPVARAPRPRHIPVVQPTASNPWLARTRRVGRPSEMARLGHADTRPEPPRRDTGQTLSDSGREWRPRAHTAHHAHAGRGNSTRTLNIIACMWSAQ
ncbi:hypothetical protein EVAR_16035_1 [Eumeta japonica]|uniref:Uncharacterized protein n=1 Tax=Eumeta variegata TaxID=151549 RepID=A0A4C1VXB3_EUMVA|nr:hypothetical protein EVAR_16035_1 [Eumeta japonica]